MQDSVSLVDGRFIGYVFANCIFLDRSQLIYLYSQNSLNT
ncbi:MAG: hypothetical protein CLLPBCKN_003762 [Chroococcidiopsis cubana SAG 39.79]|nr:hypothetical protein [Chroococcidiopsis cubana SAG 39.79]